MFHFKIQLRHWVVSQLRENLEASNSSPRRPRPEFGELPAAVVRKFRGKNTHIFDGFKMLKYVKNLFSPSRTVIFLGAYSQFSYNK
jgi:hypothetical protein